MKQTLKPPAAPSAVLKAFFADSSECSCETISQGNINDTFALKSAEKKYILQRINGEVFPDPVAVVENFARVSAHLQKMERGGVSLVFPMILQTLSGQNYCKDEHDHIWRAQHYLENTEMFAKVESPTHAFEVGKCLGRFHRLFAELPPETMATVLPGFHNLPEYLYRFNDAWKSFSGSASAKLRDCLACIEDNTEKSSFFEKAKAEGTLQPGVVHGDPKVSNVLFDKATGKAISLIDLDTVGPGLVLQDLGDCLRSCSCRAGEEARDSEISCDPDLAAQLIAGYTRENRLSAFERQNLHTALHLITFELGVRFLTDHLQGNRYFRVEKEDDNLNRALVQFKLVRSIEAQYDLLQEKMMEASG